MKMKKILIYTLLLCLAIVGGNLTRTYCYRFPTEEEMANYHAAHFPTKLIKLESQKLLKKNGDECIVFTGLHMPSGIEEIYHVEAGRRWVMPWQDYNWKSEDSKETDE